MYISKLFCNDIVYVFKSIGLMLNLYLRDLLARQSRFVSTKIYYEDFTGELYSISSLFCINSVRY